MIKIWLDCDNTPHVPFFKPVIRELEKKGYTVVLTARVKLKKLYPSLLNNHQLKLVGSYNGLKSGYGS